jgi:hypothetical protein
MRSRVVVAADAPVKLMFFTGAQSAHIPHNLVFPE